MCYIANFRKNDKYMYFCSLWRHSAKIQTMGRPGRQRYAKKRSRDSDHNINVQGHESSPADPF